MIQETCVVIELDLWFNGYWVGNKGDHNYNSGVTLNTVTGPRDRVELILWPTGILTLVIYIGSSFVIFNSIR